MVCDQTDGNIVCIVFLIFFICDLANKITKCANCIYIKNRIYILNNYSKSLKSHTCINVLLFQCCVVSVSIVLKLCENVVPYFHVTVAVTAYCTSWFSTAIFLSAVIIDLRTWTAWTCAVFPEVVFFSETENTLRRNSDFFVPDIECFIIIQIDGRIKAVCIKAYNLCKELPRPVNGFCLKVIAKRKVTKHLKECTVTCCFTYVLDITCTDTFLAGCHSCSRRFLCACEIWFQRSHTCVNQQKTLISLRNQGKAFHYKMALALHEIKEHLTKFVHSVLFHVVILLVSTLFCSIPGFQICIPEMPHIREIILHRFF